MANSFKNRKSLRAKSLKSWVSVSVRRELEKSSFRTIATLQGWGRDKGHRVRATTVNFSVNRQQFTLLQQGEGGKAPLQVHPHPLHYTQGGKQGSSSDSHVCSQTLYE